MATEIIYYEYGKNGGYDTYIRLETSSLENDLKEILNEANFFKVDLKNKKLNPKAQFLKILKAEGRILSEIKKEEKFDEINSSIDGLDLVKVKSCGFLATSPYKTTSELYLIEEIILRNSYKIKLLLSRYLAFALAPKDIFGFFGVLKEDKIFISRKPLPSGEFFFVDLKRKKILQSDEKNLNEFTKILRLEEDYIGSERALSKEELMGYLMASQLYTNTDRVKKKLYEFSYEFSKNFKARIVKDLEFNPSFY